jgi:uncharacterized repeat protein (TIGR03803 family)
MHIFYPYSKKIIRSSYRQLAILICTSVLVACGGGGGAGSDNGGDDDNGNGGGDNPKNSVVLKSTVTGMKNFETLVLLNDDNGEALTIHGNGIHSFRIALHPNDTYNVTVTEKPTGQTCTVNNGKGVIVNADSSPIVDIKCDTHSYQVGGTVTGLKPARLLKLLNNGADLTSFSGHADGSPVTFSFKDSVAIDSSYTVTVATNPSDEVCTVASAGGYTGINYDHNNVDYVHFMCDSVTNARTIGGTVTGLAKGNQIVLQNNGTDEKIITSNGAFTFATKVVANSSYEVRILNQSANQVCTLQNSVGEGQAVQSDVSNVTVTCDGDIEHSYTISGNVTGWSGSKMVLKNNKTNSFATVTADGKFSFPPVVQGTPFEIIVSTFPVLQDCSVTNGKGIIEENLTIAVSCGTVPIKTLYSFSKESDIAGYPVGLIQHSNGDLYGITTVRTVDLFRNDRLYNTGNIFKMTSQGDLSKLYTFRGSNPNDVVKYDPSYPTGLMQGLDKKIYITTYLGGPGPDQKDKPPAASTKVGEIYQLVTSPIPSVSSVFSFACGANPVLAQCTSNVAPIADLIQDTDSNFYGVAYGYAIQAYQANGGMVYKLTSGGAQTLHNFIITEGAANGLHPNGKLTLVNDFLYGTTEKGGRSGKGTIYRVSRTGTNFETIHHFTDGTFPKHPGIGGTNVDYPDGIYSDPYANPYSGLLLGKDGNLYGVAKYGGKNNAGWFFKLTLTTSPSKVESLYSFALNNNPTSELIQLNDGNFYGTTQKGGKHNMGSIFRFTPEGNQGVLTTLHDFSGIMAEGDGRTPSTRLVADSEGNLYGGTRFGGDSDQGTIYRMGRN